MKNHVVLAISLALLALPGVARGEDLKGVYDLAGKTSAGQGVASTVSIGSDLGVTRRSGSTTWRSREVKATGRRLRVTFRVATSSGLAALGAGTAPTQDDVLASLQHENVFDAVYVLSKDGGRLEETIVNRTRLAPENGWQWIKAEGSRHAAPATNALTAAQFKKVSEEKIKKWYQAEVRSAWKDEIASAKNAAEKKKLEKDRDEDLAADLDFAADDDALTEVEDEYSSGDALTDKNGVKVPLSAVAAVSVSFYPNYAGIGLSKTFVFDKRTGEILREYDVMD